MAREQAPGAWWHPLPLQSARRGPAPSHKMGRENRAGRSSAATEASGTPGTPPACLEDSPEDGGSAGREVGQGLVAVSEATEEGTSLLLGLWVRENAAPKGWGWLERPKPWLERPEPTWGCSVH